MLGFGFLTIGCSGSLLPLLLALTGSIASAADASFSFSSPPSSRSRFPVARLGYATYQGLYNDTYDLNVWKSIRYAEPPIGKLRWQAPRPPRRQGHGKVIPAVEQPPHCPQSGAFGTPKTYGFNSGPGNEDCLYLNVYSPPNATDLPVFVWIHGGGYSVFGATYDPSVLMNTNDNAFVTVEIQYRLGAFGYLASADVKKHGKLNAGLLDQRFALEWVQKYITKFGGDPQRVTIGGESSGAGSVMHHALAYGGREFDLFNNIIAASPYTPPIYNYKDSIPTGNAEAFAELAGCGQSSLKAKNYRSQFKCLVDADTSALQNASGIVSTTRGYFGSFAFLPVIDEDLIRERPSVQLRRRHVSGKRLLVGSNGNEGVPLTNPEVENKSQFDTFISTMLPRLNRSEVATLNAVYATHDSQPGNDQARFDTLGDSDPTALTQSGMATGIQQTAFNVAAEVTFHCSAQWLAEAYSVDSRQAWKYQYSVTPSYHGADLSAYWSVNVSIPNADFRHAFQKIWGSFIINDSPVISVRDATAGSPNATVPQSAENPDMIDWPEYALTQPRQMDLNTSGGYVDLVTITDQLRYYVRKGDDIVNVFRHTDTLTWEGGRGDRCEFWRNVSERVPQ